MGAFGARDFALGCVVEGLVLLERVNVAAGVFVVELFSTEGDGVEVGYDGEDPGGWDGVKGLWWSVNFGLYE